MFRGLSIICITVSMMLIVATTQAVTRQDPLRPPGHKADESVKMTASKQPKTWFVNEILHSEGRRLAIVNNITVKQGDLVDGARVVDITADHVILKYKDRTITSRLNMVPVKRLKTNTTGR